MPPSRRPLAPVLAVLLLAIGFASRVHSAAGDIPAWQPPRTGLGYDVDLDRSSAERPGPIRSREVRSRGSQPLYARLLFSWEKVETERGVFHFEEIREVMSDFADAGFEVILTPRGGNPLYGFPTLPAPSQPEYLAAWRTFLRKTAEAGRGRARFYQIADAPDRPGALPEGAGPREYAFLVKSGAVEIRGVDPKARIVLGSVGVSRLDFLEAVLQEGLGPYLDAVTLRGETGVDPARPLEHALEILLHHDPSAALWLAGQPLPEIPVDGTPPLPQGELLAAPSEANSSHEGTGESATAAPSPPPIGATLEPQTAPSASAVPPGRADTAERGAALIRNYAEALAAGSRLVLFDLQRSPSGAPELSRLQILLRRLFVPTLGPSSEGTEKIRFLTRENGEPLHPEAWRFFDASTFQVVLVYAPGEAPSPEARAVVVLDTADVSGAVVDDLLANTEKPAEEILPDPPARSTRVTVPLDAAPLLLRYQRFATPGFLKKPEAVEVTGKHELTAEEIIARHQEFQADQDSRLQNLVANGKISYHYKVANADLTVDVTTLNNFTWDRQSGAEWEQKEFYFNGVRWKSKKPPELPLVQPEKVVILPLDINLNKDYSYRLVGRETLEGRDCYVLEFSPVLTGRSLYQGRVWIDSKSFARVRIASVQTGLTPPVISNDEKDTYSPAPGSEVNPIWVLQRIDGQQIFATAGVNLVVLREVEFSDFSLNVPDLPARRKAAYATDHTILRDTPQGFRYLDRTESGERVVRESPTRSTTLGLAGVFYEKDLDFPIPLAGINRFDFNFRNTGAQTNLFFAGALIQASIQNPHLFGTRLDAGASLFGIAFSGTDKFYRGEEKLETAEVRTRTQTFSINIGHPLGNFFKVKATGALDFAQYGRGDATASSFRVPDDTTETSLRVEGEFNRSGYTMQAEAGRSRRSRWSPWGDPDPASQAVGTRLSDFDPKERTYTPIRAQLSKQFILPFFQKITLRGQYLTGRDLDRFSKYRFNFFGTRLQGFSGSGVRFDRGGLAAAVYSFNLADVVRFDATVGQARVRDTQVERLDPSSSLGGYRNFTGFGLAGNLLGPWNTVIQFDYGIAVRSDIPGLAGDQEIELLLLKFF
ncbi:MAG TPA: hypothetical protein VKL61_01525 [Candidatus Polarisedimenticolia bacterium]|nr:hypothetical protein [Candidatus Polarisedimenticolia bacterium]